MMSVDEPRRVTKPLGSTPANLPTVLLITPWYGGSAGGVAVSTETVAGALIQRGIKVVVIVLNDQTRHIGRFGEPVIPLIAYGNDVRVRSLRALFGYVWRFLCVGAVLSKLALQHRFSLAHFHYCVPAYAPFRTWLRLLGIPLLVTFRGSDINQVVSGSVAETEVRAMIQAAWRVTAVSDGLMATVHERFPEARAKSTVIRNVVPLDVWKGAPSRAPLEARDVDILFLGNLQRVKGPDELMEAFKRLLPRRPGISLWFVGSGDMEGQLRRAVSDARLDLSVNFVGRAQRSEVPGWLRRTRVLALPSRAEGLPLVAIEAQLLGVPVVASSVGGVPQAVLDQETGLLVRAGDIEGFVSALELLLGNDDAWRQFSGRAREWALRQFNPADMARAYADLYADALRARSRRVVRDDFMASGKS